MIPLGKRKWRPARTSRVKPVSPRAPFTLLQSEGSTRYPLRARTWNPVTSARDAHAHNLLRRILRTTVLFRKDTTGISATTAPRRLRLPFMHSLTVHWLYALPDIVRLHHPSVISAISSSPSTFRYAPSASSPARAHPHGPLYPLSRLLHSFPTRRLVILISAIPLPTYQPSHLPLVTLLSPRLRRASLSPLVRESSASPYEGQPPSSPQHSYGCFLAADRSPAPGVRVLVRGH